MKNFNILYVDDEESNLKGFKSIYFTEYSIFTALSGKEALKILETNEIHIIITDEKMPEMTGVEFLSNTLIKYPDPIRIILTGYSDIEVLMKAINECGIFRYLTKPWNEAEMNLTISQALDTYSLKRENTQLIHQLREANATLEEKVMERTQLIERKNEEIMIQNKELAEANSEKNNLIAIVAHDLRSPLNQIKGLASIIKLNSSNLTSDQSQFVDLIIQSTERLKKMINKILDLNAIEHKEINLKMERADLDEIIRDVVNQARVLSSEKGLTVTTQSTTENNYALADVNYLIQVLENLLSNAIKFSPPNKNIFIETENSGDTVKIRIRDEGPGIGEEDMKRIFGKYQQLSARPSSGEESSGLGLHIAKKYVETMNGKIWCESIPGDGASFIIEFAKEF